MAYQLRNGLSYCEVDGHLIFLDLERDRYFSLPDNLERAFRSHLPGSSASADADALIRAAILIDTAEAGLPIAPVRSAVPSRSALEHIMPAARLDALALADVVTTVVSTRLQLKWRRLDHIIDGLVAYRQRMTDRVLQMSDASHTRMLLDGMQAFRSARRFAPIDTSCLLDSISLVRFLARRELSARIVFGVTHHPFAAHCWVQAGDWVLNDTIGDVLAYTPILDI